MGEHAGLAHADDVGQGTNGDTLEPETAGQPQTSIQQDGTRALSLVQVAATLAGRGVGGGWAGGGRHGADYSKIIER